MMSYRGSSWVGRLAGALLGAAISGLLVAAIEASAVTSTSLPYWRSFLTVAGLVAPLVVGVAFLVWVLRAMFFPDRARERLKRWLSAEGPVGRERAAILFAAPLALFILLLASARFGLELLSSELSPMPAGSALALGIVLFGAALTLGVIAMAQVVRDSAIPVPAPGFAFGVSLSLSSVALILMIALGETSGAGTVLSQFGVLRREELDLRPLARFLFIGGGAWVAWAAPAPRRLSSALVCVALGMLPLAVASSLASTLLQNPALSLSVEREAPLAARVLVSLRQLLDRDGDGYSARWGGGDCDDQDPGRSPDAEDIPGNGIDEDCSGTDQKIEPLVARPPVTPPRVGAAELRAVALAKLPERLNVVLLTVDSLRWDLGYTGYPREITAHIDQLAAESVVFERAYALASYTAKSLPPMLIGKYAGETHRGFLHFNRFDKRETFVAERLQRGAIRTVSVQGHWYFYQAQYGMARGFDVVNSSAAPKKAQREGDRGWTSDRLSDAVLEELEKLEDQRFFLWAHYTDPHAEYVEHEDFNFGTGSRARYDSEVAFVDAHIGRVLAALRQSPSWDRTVVILSSDHGEAFGEHRMIRHGFELWEELIRVPLLVRIPNVPARRIATPRSQIDLVPTLLDLFSLPPASGQGGDFTSGESLLVELVGSQGSQPSKRPIFVDMPEGPHNEERRAYIDQDLKLTTRGTRALGLYDLAKDPGETEDLSGDPARTRAAMDRFQEFKRTLREVRVRRPK